MNMNRRSRGAPSRDTLADMRATIAVHTGGLAPGGLRPDFLRLPEDDQRRAVELIRKAGKGRTWSFSKLSNKDRETLEGLIERAAGEPGVFERARESEEIAALAAEAHRAAVARPVSRRQENGIFEEVARCIEDGFLAVADLAVLASFVTVFVSGKPLGPRSRVEHSGDETVLIVEDANMGPFSGQFDPESQIGPRWQMTLAHLERNEWLNVTRHGKQWTVAPGRRLTLAMAGKPIKDRVLTA